MKSFLKLIVYLGVPVLLFFGLISSVVSSDMFNVASVELKGLTPAESPPYLLEQAHSLRRKMDDYVGKKIWQIGMKDIIGSVESYPWVSSASVSRLFPNKLQVTLERKLPTAGIVKNPRQIILVAEDGSLFPPAPFHEVPEVVILTGKLLAASEELRRQALKVYKQVPEAGWLSKTKVAELGFDESVGYTLTLAGGRTKVFLGEEEIPLRLARVEKVLTFLQSKGIVARVIDANYQKKVLVRPRKGS